MRCELEKKQGARAKTYVAHVKATGKDASDDGCRPCMAFVTCQDSRLMQNESENIFFVVIIVVDSIALTCGTLRLVSTRR